MYAKTEDFDLELQDLAQAAKLFSHPARLAIIRLLAARNTCISGDIANELPLSRATVCQHLQELKNARLIRGEISGLNVNYCLNVEKWSAIKKQFEALFDMEIQDVNCICIN
ncbi:MAG: metalloregulator ArsR/SmtB family transcription factor [Saprospiraceae bacterium]|nr:metalloregulator ArsR/SmtB family transcription factor [Saprospiraceae bacterium]